MSVFVDTGVFFAHHDTDAERHADAVAAIDAVLDGEYGQPFTSDYVLDETVTLIVSALAPSKRPKPSPSGFGVSHRIRT